MQLCSYLSQSRHGIYYFRYPLHGQDTTKRRTARLSLRTRCPQTAQLYARQLGGYYAALKERGILQVMDSDKVKELVSDYFDDVFRYRIENIDKDVVDLFKLGKLLDFDPVSVIAELIEIEETV